LAQVVDGGGHLVALADIRQKADGLAARGRDRRDRFLNGGGVDVEHATDMPSFAKRDAIPSPMPAPPPVTNAVLVMLFFPLRFDGRHPGPCARIHLTTRADVC